MFTQPPIQRIQGAFSLCVEQPRQEADAKVKNDGAVPPPQIHFHGTVID